MDEPAWSYSDDLRLVLLLGGASTALFGIGILVVGVGGPDGEDAADVVLALGIFVIVFAVFLLVPRIRSRGPRSFSLLVELSMDEVEAAVTSAAEAMGRTTHVEVPRSRSSRPPRNVAVDGLGTRFLVRPARYREEGRGAPPWTELVSLGKDVDRDAAAKELRERITSRLAASLAAKE